MKTLKDILYRVSVESIDGDRDLKISGITQDSRKVKTGFLFVAISGVDMDGHDFIKSAIENGAAAIVLEKDMPTVNVAKILVKDAREAVALMAANFFNHPSKEINLVGITGTNWGRSWNRSTDCWGNRGILKKY